MAQRNRLTNNSDETDIASLISGDTIFTIPYFQRAYKWKPERIKQLNSDIMQLVDESTDYHFLGAVIVHGRRSNPSEPFYFDVIDGQQRITTLFIYLCAIVKTLITLEEYDEAAALLQKYLIISRDTKNLSNIKLHPCKDDRQQLNDIFVEIFSNEEFLQTLGTPRIKYLPSSGKPTGVIKNNYHSALKFLRSEYEQGGIERIRSTYSAMLNNMSVVQIDVWDPTNGPKIFDSLNSRQEPMTIGDLIRNEIFSKVANEDPYRLEQIDAEHWQPFYKKFDQNGKNLFDSYFFPFGLIKRPNLKKSEVYSTLRKDWDTTKNPEDIIKELSTYQDAFIDLQCGTNHCGHSKQIHRAFKRLVSAAVPGSTLPFLMQLSKSVKNNTLSETNAEKIISAVESFLIRRAVCGHEPTGLHAVFKRLWSDCENDLTADRVIIEISKHKTVAWPNATDFKKAIKDRDLYGAKITKYIISEHDRGLNGDPTESQLYIEHILPKSPDSKWFDFFTTEQHLKLKDKLANLLPLSIEMNSSLSNKPYEHKRERYRQDSAFKSTRVFADAYDIWTPETLTKRAEDISNWAVERWPHERVTTI